MGSFLIRTSRRSRHRCLKLAASVLLVLTTSGAAGAGVAAAGPLPTPTPTPVRTEPAANSVVRLSPTEFLIESSAPLDRQSSAIAVYNDTHKAMATAAPQMVANNPNALQLALPTLPKGFYTVVWHLAATDGTALGAGSAAFQVNPASTTPTIVTHPKPAPVSAPARKVLARWLSFLFVMIFLGALAVRFLVTAPASRDASGNEGAALLASTDRRVLLVAGAALFAFLPAIWAELAVASGTPALGFWQAVGPAKVLKFLTLGNAGHFWLARLLLIAVAAVAILPAAVAAAARRRPGSRPTGAVRRAGPIMGAGPIMAVGLVAGVGEMVVSTIPTTRPATAAQPRAVFSAALDLGHLLSASIWVGGLVALVALAALALPAGLGSRFWPRAIPRFSKAATVSLGVIVLTGLWTAWIHVGAPHLLWSTIYGERLLVKLIGVAALALVGSYNLFWVIPQVAAIRAAAPTARAGNGPSRLTVVMHHFRRTIAIEAVLGIGILAVVPFLSGSARNQSFQAKQANLTQTARAGDLVVSLTPSGTIAGFTDYDVRVPKSAATGVRLGFASPDLGVPETDIRATPVGDHYRVTGLYTPIVGHWQVKAMIDGAGSPSAPAVFDLKVVAKAPKLAKSKPPKVHRATWEWGAFDVVSVLAILLGANRISRRLSARRVRAVTTPEDARDDATTTREPELSGVGTS